MENKVSCSYANLRVTSTGFMPTNDMTREHQRGIAQQLMGADAETHSQTLRQSRGNPSEKEEEGV